MCMCTQTHTHRPGQLHRHVAQGKNIKTNAHTCTRVDVWPRTNTQIHSAPPGEFCDQNEVGVKVLTQILTAPVVNLLPTLPYL